MKMASAETQIVPSYSVGQAPVEATASEPFETQFDVLNGRWTGSRRERVPRLENVNVEALALSRTKSLHASLRLKMTFNRHSVVSVLKSCCHL